MNECARSPFTSSSYIVVKTLRDWNSLLNKHAYLFPEIQTNERKCETEEWQPDLRFFTGISQHNAHEENQCRKGNTPLGVNLLRFRRIFTYQLVYVSFYRTQFNLRSFVKAAQSNNPHVLQCIHATAEQLAREFNYSSVNKDNQFEYCSAKYSKFYFENGDTTTDDDFPEFAKNNSHYMEVNLEKDSHFYNISVNTNNSCVHVPTNIFYQGRFTWKKKSDSECSIIFIKIKEILSFRTRCVKCYIMVERPQRHFYKKLPIGPIFSLAVLWQFVRGPALLPWNALEC